MRKKLNFYFFGDIGEYDCYNPAFVCEMDCAPEILYLIAESEPFSISKHDISIKLDVNEKLVSEVIEGLDKINAIETKNNTFRINFPVFLVKDITILKDHVNNIGEIISKKIMSMDKDLYSKVSELKCAKYHSSKRILYHTICDEIFDGTAFDFFENKGTFCTSKIQPGNRNYIIVAYEDSEIVEKHSNKILCSSNNYRTGEVTFNSFGDSDGARKDMFRFFRLMQRGIANSSPFEKLNTCYNKVMDEKNREIANECGRLIRRIIDCKVNYNGLMKEEKNLADFLYELEYVDSSKENGNLIVIVPVFYEYEKTRVIKELSDLVLNAIYPLVEEIFNRFESKSKGLTAVRHKVNMKETANELWHQIFGAANEYLVKEEFVEAPNFIEGEGRYLRSLLII